jgi:hypothetical protein
MAIAKEDQVKFQRIDKSKKNEGRVAPESGHQGYDNPHHSSSRLCEDEEEEEGINSESNEQLILRVGRAKISDETETDSRVK